MQELGGQHRRHCLATRARNRRAIWLWLVARATLRHPPAHAHASPPIPHLMTSMEPSPMACRASIYWQQPQTPALSSSSVTNLLGLNCRNPPSPTLIPRASPRNRLQSSARLPSAIWPVRQRCVNELAGSLKTAGQTNRRRIRLALYSKFVSRG